VAKGKRSIKQAACPSECSEVGPTSISCKLIIAGQRRTRSWFYVTLSSVVAVFGAPGRSSSKTDVRLRRRRVTVHSIQALFDFAERFPFEKQESGHRPILLSLHFSKIRGHVRFHKQSKQNFESDSAEISTVAVYENVLHDSKFLLR